MHFTLQSSAFCSVKWYRLWANLMQIAATRNAACTQKGAGVSAIALLSVMAVGTHCPPKRSKKVMISSHVLNSSLPHCTTVPMKLGMA